MDGCTGVHRMGWQERDDYKHEKRRLDKVYESCDPLDKRSQNLYFSELIQLEMRYSANHEIAMLTSNLAFKWRDEGNPYYMDIAQVRCTLAKVSPSPTLQQAITEAALSRINGSAVGTAQRIAKDITKSKALTLMMNLIFHGAPMYQAASKTAMWIKSTYPEMKPYLASTLEKYYTEEVRNTGSEEKHFEVWRKWQTEETRKQWAEILNALPEAPDDLIGNRRD